MSGRTVPRFVLAGLLAVAFAAPAAAQPLPAAPMPRECPDELAALQQHLAELKRLMAQAAPPAPREFTAVGPDGLQLVPLPPPGGYRLPPGCCLPPTMQAYDPAPAPNPLIGTWYRDTGVGVVAATFMPDELKLCLTQREGANTVTFTLTAHYTLTKDGLVFGAVTGADVDATIGDKGGVGIELAEMSLVMQELADRPFSFRAKATSAGLMVSQLKFAAEGATGKDYMVLGGLYKSAKDGKVPAPAPAPLKTVGGVGRADCQLPPQIELPVLTQPYPTVPTLPTMSEPVQRIDFNISTPQVLAPTMPCPPKPGETVGGALNRLPPASLPAGGDAMKGMAADAFGQLLKQASRSGTDMGGMTLPPGKYLEHFPQYYPPDPPFPERYDPTARQAVLAPFAVQVANGTSVPKAAHVGTWVRMIGAKQCVVQVEADHLTITVSEAREFDGTAVTGHLIFTADYHLTRDGLTAAGLLTSVDVKFDGDIPEDEEEAMLEKIAEMRKALEEKPFALTFRRYGEALVIGNVRMPEVGDRMETQPGTYVGGRYASVGDKPLPKLKVVKAVEPRPGYGLPSATVPQGFYGYGDPLVPPGVIGAPSRPGTGPLPAPTGDLLPPQAIPCPTVPRPIGFVMPESRQRVIQEMVPPPVAPTPTQPMMMPQPIPPAVSCEEKKVPATEMAAAWRTRIASLPDPTRDGAKVTGISGQLFLYGGPKMEFALADGTLTVDLTDETPLAAGQAAAKPQRWQFDKATLRSLRTVDETFGKSYVLFLPWPEYTPDVTKVRISARYDPESGETLKAAPSVVTLESENPTPAMVMPQPVPPVVQAPYSISLGSGLRVIVPPVSQTPKTDLDTTRQLFNFYVGLFGTQQHASDPNIRATQLLYSREGDDLRMIQNEWRRFWFNDLPNLTPERIHGGIR